MKCDSCGHAINPICTIPEAAELLRVTRQTIYNLIERGDLTRYHVGSSVRLQTAEVLALIGLTP